jgi:two-component system nitrogen regulation sensor histidine kinase NtrY
MQSKPARRPGVRRWRLLRRRFNRWVARVDLFPRLEVAVAGIVVILGLSSYAILTG